MQTLLARSRPGDSIESRLEIKVHPLSETESYLCMVIGGGLMKNPPFKPLNTVECCDVREVSVGFFISSRMNA